ncbi:hypothetical protein D9M68_816170 [compost metagenome]
MHRIVEQCSLQLFYGFIIFFVLNIYNRFFVKRTVIVRVTYMSSVEIRKRLFRIAQIRVAHTDIEQDLPLLFRIGFE